MIFEIGLIILGGILVGIGSQCEFQKWTKGMLITAGIVLIAEVIYFTR